MSSPPLVSAIIPTYNRAATVCRAVDSVLGQTWKPIEVIVVDDGSQDDTLKTLAAYGDKIRVIPQHNQGPGAARNRGIREARGEIISFLDSDDIWLPEKTQRQAELLLKTRSAGVKCSICNARMVYPSGYERTSFSAAMLHPKIMEGIWTNPAEVLVTRFLLFNQTVDIWRDALDEAGYFRQDLRIHEDYELQIRVALLGTWAFINEPLTVWFGSEAPSASKVSNQDHSRSVLEVIRGLNSSEKWGPRLPKTLLQKRVELLELESRAFRHSNGSGTWDQMKGRFLTNLAHAKRALYYRSQWVPKMAAELAV